MRGFNACCLQMGLDRGWLAAGSSGLRGFLTKGTVLKPCLDLTFGVLHSSQLNLLVTLSFRIRGPKYDRHVVLC